VFFPRKKSTEKGKNVVFDFFLFPLLFSLALCSLGSNGLLAVLLLHQSVRACHPSYLPEIGTMFTQWKRTILSLTAISLMLGIFALWNRSEREAIAQDGGDRAAKAQPAKGNAQETDREAIAKAARSFIAAFENGDAKAVAAHWTESGEYVSDDGTTIRGRADIEKEYAELFAKKKMAAKVAVDVDSIRFPSRDTAIEEGHFKIRYGKELAVASKYTILHVRENGKWLMAVVREWPNDGATLRDLDWLIGAWTAKRGDTEITTTYQWWGGKSFIRMDITIKDKNETVKGFQMIGKDASTGQLRSWTFDPDGSFGEATWSREGKKWVLDSAAVMNTGEVQTATNIITHLDEDTFTFQSVQRTVGDADAPDIGPVRVARVKAKN
jgi:uncharacterized protein (TIGR02246 family)